MKICSIRLVLYKYGIMPFYLSNTCHVLLSASPWTCQVISSYVSTSPVVNVWLPAAGILHCDIFQMPTVVSSSDLGTLHVHLPQTWNVNCLRPKSTHDTKCMVVASSFFSHSVLNYCHICLLQTLYALQSISWAIYYHAVSNFNLRSQILMVISASLNAG
jgi:hypothetical protein